MVLFFFPLVKDNIPATGTRNELEAISSKVKLDEVRVNNYSGLTDSLFNSPEVALFYKNRDNKLAWLEKGRINRNINDLVKRLDGSYKDGLSGEFYNLPKIKSGIEAIKRSESNDENWISQLVQLDVLLSNAYMNFASDLSSGRLNLHNLGEEWIVYPKPNQPDIAEYLEESIKTRNISKSLERLKPQNEQYYLLANAYNSLLKVKSEGGWPLPGYLSRLQENDEAAGVIALKKYLLATGDLDVKNTNYLNSTVFDEDLTQAVKQFQQRHGLKPDGIVGNKTIAEMNHPVDYRLNQVKLNLDRIRWFPDDFGRKYIIINIPDYRLGYYDNGKLMETMNVVVGKTEHFTPVLKDSIIDVVFNPQWNVPASIATKEMLPKIQNDTNWLAKNDYMLLEGSYTSTDDVAPGMVKWEKITENNFPYRIVQKPGGKNALGRVKFVMTNNQSIYLHDTPSEELFSQVQRDFSHGCIRLQKPVELAQILLEEQLPVDTIQSYLAQKETKVVVLQNPVMVNVLYQTAWVDEQTGQIQFREDVYGFDEISLAAFEKDHEKH